MSLPAADRIKALDVAAATMEILMLAERPDETVERLQALAAGRTAKESDGRG